MKKIFLALFLVLLLAGCAKAPLLPVDETASNVGSDISDVADIGKALDVSDLDALDKDLSAVLDGLEG